MKKAWGLLGLILVITFFGIFLPVKPANATSDIVVYIDGQCLNLDQLPEIENDRVLVPLRAIFEALEAQVDWKADTQTVNVAKNSTTLSLTIGEQTAYKNGQPVSLDVPAKLSGGRTLVPLRFVSEALGAEVKWDDATQTVNVWSSGYAPAPTTGPLKVHYIDVGQADSILIQLPDAKNILIDGGNNADGPAVIRYLKDQGVSRLDYVIATHPHEDHIGGLDAIIDAFDIGKVYAPRVIHTSQTYEDFLRAVQGKGLKITEAKAGVSLDTGSDASAVFVAPNGTDYEDLNNYSAVLKLNYKDTSFLFAGDAEAVSENEMLLAGYNLKADVLKVGHHGSDSSTTPEFLAAVSPKYAVISVGKDNDYGHPSPDVLTRLSAAGIEVFRTDEAGTVVTTSDGTKITFDKSASPIKERAPDKYGGSTVSPVPTGGIGNDITVYITATGTKYHRDGCRYLQKSKIPIALEEAKAQGYEPCGVCNPPF